MQKNENNEKKGISPLAAAVTGAVIGAGIATGGAVALRDKKTQEKVKKALGNIKDQAINYVEDMRKLPTENKKSAINKKETKKLTKLIKVTNTPIKKAAKKL